ncbi:MAG TPA: MoxR family ATPase [Candidatus Bariatricus faecipullorum]|nr:MoxR family ATPase [Candidatus Bariatricus faecipullorum]
MQELYLGARKVTEEVKKAVVGKDQAIELIMAAVLARGHVLIEDIPGVGKTTMALAFARAMGIEEKRVQFTPDVLPADLTGFSMYRKETGQFVYQPGAVMCNLLLADEINRTSPKTQSALLEVMEERTVTVDGITRKTGEPFTVIATENPEGSAGTQLLPESQLDRFMICLSMGYPTVEEEVEILKRRKEGSPVETVTRVLSGPLVLAMQEAVEQVFIHDAVYRYMAELAKATRNQELLQAGISPRGTVALAAMSRAWAWMSGRGYVIPDDVREVFFSTAGHRIRLSTRAKVSHVKPEDVLGQVLEEVKAPSARKQ